MPKSNTNTTQSKRFKKKASDYVEEAIKDHQTNLVRQANILKLTRDWEIGEFTKWIEDNLLAEGFDGKVFRGKYAIRKFPNCTVQEIQTALNKTLESLDDDDTCLFVKECRPDHAVKTDLYIEVGYEEQPLPQKKRKSLPPVKKVFSEKEAYSEWRMMEE